MLFCRFIVQDVPEETAIIEDLLLSLEADALNSTEEEFWQIAREYEDVPIFSNIYLDILYEKFENAVTEAYPKLDLQVSYHTNCLNSKFFINQKPIIEKPCFDEVINEALADIDSEAVEE